MSVEKNKATVRRLFEEGFNQGKVQVADEMMTPDAIDHEGLPMIMGILPIPTA